MNKKTQTIILVSGGVLLLVSLVFFARPDGALKTPSRESDKEIVNLSVENSFHDFGSISMAAGSVSASFLLHNSGEEPLMIDRLYTSCMCTEAFFVSGDRDIGPFGMPGHGFTPRLRETIAPGESVAIKVVFDPAAHGPAGVGPIEREMYIESDSGLTKVGFSAVVTP